MISLLSATAMETYDASRSKPPLRNEAKAGHRVTYNLSLTQLQTPITPDVTYIFVVRHENRWDSFVIIDRAALDEKHSLNGIGTEQGDRLVLHFRFHKGEVLCGHSDFTQYNGNWSRFPLIVH